MHEVRRGARIARADWIGVPTLLGSLFAALPAVAADAPDHARIIESLAPHDRGAYVQRLVAQRQGQVGQGLGADAAGPVLTAFNAPTTLNVSKGAAPFKVTVKATDDLSGVRVINFYAYGPSGQNIFLSAPAGFPLTKFSSPAGISNVNRMLEPGSWNITYGYAYDAAGNFAYFDQTSLQALGNATFTVVNSSGYDIVKPTLTDGKILTPSVSLSSFVPGTTGAAPFAQIKVSAADTGSTTVSGVSSVYLSLCKVADANVCINARGDTYATAQATMALYVGAQVSASNGNVTGTYEVAEAYVYDHAGNYSQYKSTKFGGSTDFSTFFPTGTSIKLKP